MIQLIIEHIAQYGTLYTILFCGGCAGGAWHFSKEPKEK